jgi:excinuclease ABC subunit A
LFSGVSGSGKSSLAFDTLYAEGQRRYVESLSQSARQFMGQMPKPDVDLVTGLSPSISISQKSTGNNPRSTVGTITEIYDFLRVLYARVGTGYCPTCNVPIQAQTSRRDHSRICHRLAEDAVPATLWIMAPLARGQKGEFRDTFEDLRKQGFTEPASMAKRSVCPTHQRWIEQSSHDVEIVIDRVEPDSRNRGRITTAVESGLKLGRIDRSIAFASGKRFDWRPSSAKER